MAEDTPGHNYAELRWAIIGAGRVGKTLGLLARRLGIEVVSTWNRSAEAAKGAEALLSTRMSRHEPLADIADELIADADVVWVTVVDSAIEQTARQLAAATRADQLVLHTSGSLGSGILTDAGIASPVGSLHPLQAITDPQRAVDALANVAWSVEGDAPVVGYAKWLMAKIGVEPAEIDSSKKTLYHASAVTTANLLVALMDAAFQMGEAAGMSREEARAMMLPLARSCVENLERQDTGEALSGPAARGDQETIDRHLAALEALGDAELVRIYEVLTSRAKRLVDKPSQP